MYNFFKRTITGIFLVIGILFISFSSNLSLFLGLLFLSSVALYEMKKMFQKKGTNLNLLKLLGFNTLSLYMAYINKPLYLIIILSLYMIVEFIYIIIEDKGINHLIFSLFLYIYISLTYSYLLMISDNKYIFYIFGIAASTDTFAYLVGNVLGKRKLIERLSPNKTIEGSIGGIIGGVLFTLVFILVFKIDLSFKIIIMSIISSILSQLGDLSASYLKRWSGIKDYGYIFIGHGGVMDRFDSIILIAPIIYYMVEIAL